MITKQFKVKGMHCESCEILIKDNLEEVQGIKEVRVSFEKGVIFVRFEEDKVTSDKIKSIIINEGYDVK